MSEHEVQRALILIAQKHLRVGTLEAKNSDEQNFYDLTVWDIETALRSAFELGRKCK